MKYYTTLSCFRQNTLRLASDPHLSQNKQDLEFASCLKKSILLYGETNVGKTEITSRYLTYLLSFPKIEKIYVFDMAPERFQTKEWAMGGKLSEFDDSFKKDQRVIYFSYMIIPPRSKSTNYIDVLKVCLENYELIFNDFRSVLNILSKYPNQNSALIINDFSIFLHLGSPIFLVKLLPIGHTVFVNSYYGSQLAEDYGSNISWRETIMVNLLIRHFNYSIHLITQ